MGTAARSVVPGFVTKGRGKPCREKLDLEMALIQQDFVNKQLDSGALYGRW